MEGKKRTFVTENTILSFGQQCFQRTHYLCSSKDGNCLPWDTCPLEAVLANLYINKVEKKGSWAKVSGTYDLLVWFKYARGKLLGQAEAKDLAFTAWIPLLPVGKDVLQDHQARLWVQNTKLKVLQVSLEKDLKSSCPGCNYRLRVKVEQEIVAFEYGLRPLFLPSCEDLKIIAAKPVLEESGLNSEPSQEKGSKPVGPPPALLTQEPEKQEEQKPTSPAIIKGKVINQKGRPLFRVKIKAFDGTRPYMTRTNLEGYYFLPLYPDSYEITVAKNGYIAQTSKLSLKSGEIRSLDFELQEDPTRRGLRLKI